MSEDPHLRLDPTLSEALRQFEARLARLELHLQLPPLPVAPPAGEIPAATVAATVVPPVTTEQAEEELEFVVGQNWFASVGVLVLTCGVGFALSLPLAGLPPVVPSLTGYVLAAALLVVARVWNKSFELVAGYLRGAGMALLYLATLRLFFFGETHVLDIDSVGGRSLLVLVVLANLALALRARSPGLLGLALFTGLLTAVAVGSPYFVFVSIALLAGVSAVAAVRLEWPGLLLFIIPTGYLTHLLWAFNRPWSGRPMKVLAEPSTGIFFLLVYALIFAVGSLLRRNRTREELPTVLAVLLNCGAGYGLFLLTSFGSTAEIFTPAHFAAAVIFLGLAVAFWRREASRFSTFFYAMTGYLALSAAIVKRLPSPEVFIWLSGQSFLVVATAMWFRSRLIVVANFFIYVSIVLAYMAVAQNETGISVGFGVVALLTARILNWQRERLELKTELMRNAYLASAFVVFPYALYHLLPPAFVSLAWIGIAVVYYGLNLVVRNPKYRWMGHLTLLLTVLYVIVIGIAQLAPTYRVVSFLALGTVLLVVSLIFTRVRKRR